MGKTASGSIAGSITVVLVWALTSLKVDVPPEVAAALTTIIMAVTVRLTGRSREVLVDEDE